MDVVFAGTPEFAVPSLEMLAAGPHRVAAVYTRADRPSGRGRRMSPSAVKAAATGLGIPIEQPGTLSGREARRRLAGYRPDLIVVAAYGLILPPEILELPPAGCINVHASLLPRWRGAAPIQHTLLAGDAETGVTIMQMDAGIDTGDILLARRCPIGAGETAGSLTDRLARVGAEALRDTIAGIEEGRLAPRPQDETVATSARRLRKSDALIDWSRDARHLERMVRAFDPWPVAFTCMGKEPLRILRVEALVGELPRATLPGTVVRADARGIDVQTGRGQLRVLELQRPGKQPLGAEQFLNGRRLAPGHRLGGDPGERRLPE